MGYSLPTTLQGLINGLLLEKAVCSWRIYGEKQVVVCIRFDENSRHEANYSTPNSLDMQQAGMAYHRKPPCSIARDRQRYVKWSSRGEQDRSFGISADLSNNANRNIDMSEYGAYNTSESVLVNNHMEDSGLCNVDHSLQSNGALTSDMAVATSMDNICHDKEIQCVQHDISTAPMISAETQTQKSCKSKNIQADPFPLKDKSTQSFVKKQSAFSNTDIIATTNRFTMIHISALNVECQTSFTSEKCCQVTADNATIGTSTDAVKKAGVSCQTHHSEMTSVSTETETTSQDNVDEYEDPEPEQSDLDTDYSYGYYGQYDNHHYGYRDGYSYGGTYSRPRRSHYYYTNYYNPP